MAETVTGRSHERLLRSRVYAPLGLSETSLPQGARLPQPFAHGYFLEPGQPPEDVSEAIGMSGVWASGGMVSTPTELGRFMRGYVNGSLFGPSLQRRQRRWVPGSSEPIGPGSNSAGLGLFRYRCEFAAASSDGRRSATVSANDQLNQEQAVQAPFRALRRVFVRAVCSALARG
jgi:D-alanyl-D-alanine carboxypeptidase